MYKPFVSAVILCAGRSERMGMDTNKQFLLIDGTTIACRTITTFNKDPDISEIIVVTSENDLLDMQKLVEQGSFEKVSKIILGGDSRTESSKIGVLETSEKSEIVLIHDGARPFVDDVIIENVIKEAAAYGAAAPGIPLKDTVKEINKEGIFQKTLNRDRLYNIQTPQGFRKTQYLDAILKMNLTEALFDDCQLMEAAGHIVKLTMGSEFNIKITTPNDLLLAEAICHIKKGMESK